MVLPFLIPLHAGQRENNPLPGVNPKPDPLDPDIYCFCLSHGHPFPKKKPGSLRTGRFK